MDKPKQRPNRSRSGAQTVCPKCEKRLRGPKGLQTHLVDIHDLKLDAARLIVAPLKGMKR